MTSHDDARAEPGGADEVAATRDALHEGTGLPGAAAAQRDGVCADASAGPAPAAERRLVGEA